MFHLVFRIFIKIKLYIYIYTHTHTHIYIYQHKPQIYSNTDSQTVSNERKKKTIMASITLYHLCELQIFSLKTIVYINYMSNIVIFA